MHRRLSASTFSALLLVLAAGMGSIIAAQRPPRPARSSLDPKKRVEGGGVLESWTER